ncbi:MAG TPA: inositol-3-phosphate synthase [Bacteroidota bacterium]|jgi:myo-inositol-1-phosphate synthase|nr:inositol-3-phosphate synthase [Bacteroidota bacterium]
MKPSYKIQKPKGKLGVLIVGFNGAVSTTFLAGVIAVRKGIAQPIGSLTQMGTIRLGKRTERRSPFIRKFLDLAKLDDLVFGGWDIRDENCYESAVHAGVLHNEHLDQVKKELQELRPMKAVFDQYYVKRLKGTYVKKGKTKYELMEQLREDIRLFKKEKKLDRCVLVWCGSTEVFIGLNGIHKNLKKLEEGMRKNHADIAPSMLYAYAALQEGVPFANGAPNLTVDCPAIMDLAKRLGVPISGKDFKTGQTLLKTVLAPMLKARLIGLNGWFSSNILGNRDGEVLDDPESFKTKEESKLSVLEGILQPELYPDLYKDYYHKVRINYYPPRGDNKESWDNIDIFGWMGYPMQVKVNFLCRDSILAAPIVLDLVLFMDLAQRAGMKGIQEWLSFYFKSPMVAPGLYPEHDLFIQLMKLKNTLRHLKGEELITHLGLEYYD